MTAEEIAERQNAMSYSNCWTRKYGATLLSLAFIAIISACSISLTLKTTKGKGTKDGEKKVEPVI